MAKKKEEECVMIFTKGDGLKDGVVQRMRMIKTLCRFVCHYDSEAELHEDGVTVLFIIPKSHVGDTDEVSHRCVNKVYLDSVFTEKEMERKVEQLIKLCDEAGCQKDVGYGIVLKYTDRLLMKGISSSIYYR